MVLSQLVPAILNDPQVIWTTEATTRYARLFLPSSVALPTAPAEIDEASTHLRSLSPPDGPTTVSPGHPSDFVFKPDISALIDPNATQHAAGSDAWALNRGLCTVTPLRAAFQSARKPSTVEEEVRGEDGLKVWKL